MLIFIDYKMANTKLNELIGIANRVRCEIETMEGIIEELGIFWKSDAQAQYAMLLNADLYTVEAMLINIKKRAKELAEAIKCFDDVERSVELMIATL